MNGFWTVGVPRLTVLMLVVLLGSGCGGDNAASDGVRVSGGSGRDAAKAAEQDAGAADAEITPLPADAADSDREQIKGVLRYGFDAEREGDTEKYCSVLVAKLARELSNCEALEDGFVYMRENGTAIDDPEILEVTLEGDTAYASAYEQEDREAPSFRTPTDYQLQQADGRWRISMTRYRTDREEGPAECFVGGSFNDLC